jgi:hypothetical protein
MSIGKIEKKGGKTGGNSRTKIKKWSARGKM